MTPIATYLSLLVWLLAGYAFGRWHGAMERDDLRSRVAASRRIIARFSGHTDNPSEARFVYVGGPWDGDVRAFGDPPFEVPTHGGLYRCDEVARCYLWQPE